MASGAIGCAALEVPAVESRLWLAWSERGLTALAWAGAGAAASDVLAAPPPERALPEPYASCLEGYLSGQPVDPASLPVDLGGTEFQRRVWHALRRVERGAVRTYQGIAADVGSPRAMRAVGMANGANPVAIVVPCHRIVEAGMRIGGYSGGLHRKRHLLALEGVKVVGDTVQPGQLELI